MSPSLPESIRPCRPACRNPSTRSSPCLPESIHARRRKPAAGPSQYLASVHAPSTQPAERRPAPPGPRAPSIAPSSSLVATPRLQRLVNREQRHLEHLGAHNLQAQANALPLSLLHRSINLEQQTCRTKCVLQQSISVCYTYWKSETSVHSTLGSKRLISRLPW